jgi:SAM-dependent methyltransferase
VFLTDVTRSDLGHVQASDVEARQQVLRHLEAAPASLEHLVHPDHVCLTGAATHVPAGSLCRHDLPDRQREWRDRGAMGDVGPVIDDIAAGSARSDAPSPADGYVEDPAVRAEWDRRYADREQLWSGQPNGALVAEVAGLTPGRVLDVGCGEGADAVWLARGGWDVTALEVSGVALERAAGHARDAGVDVRWVHAGLAEAVLPPASFDLVSAQYPALLRTPDAAAERALLAAVAPGGVLLLVHHAGMDVQHAHDSGFDPADYVWPPMVAALLDDDWEVELNEQRPRIAPDGGAGAHPVDDLVLRTRRLH